MSNRAVLTTKGLIPFEDLDVTDVVKDTDNSRDIATEYRLSGELVRRDVAVSILRPLTVDYTEGDVR